MRLGEIILFLGIWSPFSGSVILSQEVADPSVLGESFSASAAASTAPHRLDAFVNWDYRHRQKLKGWRNTAILIRKTLAEWSRGPEVGETVENAGPTALRGFLTQLDSRRGDGGMHMVYLSAHQSPAGEWEFPDRQKIAWEQLLAGMSLDPDPRRIIILDACHAEAVPDEWRRKLVSRGFCLFASSPRELTFELIVNRRQPVWFEKRYPQELAWLEDHFGKKWLRKDSRLSFLGFVWLRAFLKTKTPPRTAKEWNLFLRTCEAEAEAFRRESSRRLSSTIRMLPPSDSG